MAGRKTGRRVSTRPFNWLQELDREAATLPRAANWLEYGPLMLARYANLRPQPIPGNPHSQIACESGEKVAAQQFAEWESRIAKNTEAAGCLVGLSAELRKQLAALLLETMAELDDQPALDRGSQFRRCLRKEAATRLRVLNRKLQKAQQELEGLLSYAQDSGTGNALDVSIHSARQMLGHPFMVAASNALRDLDVKYLPDSQEHIEIASESLRPENDDLEVFGMVRLYWFFRHGCSLSGDESEVRVARLRNVFWTECGVSAVTYRAKYIVGQSQGCEAVHVAVRRFRP